MASQSFCKRLSDGDVNDQFNLVVFGDEPRPAYDRVRLTDYFDGSSASDLELAPREWYESRGIELCTNQRVESINRQERTVRAQDGSTHRYDQLVLATGSFPFVPPIEGINGENVFVYRTIEDLEQIAAKGKESRTAAVLGGGLLGLEAAKALRDMHLVTNVVEMAPGLMPRQLDSESATILREQIEKMGVRVHLTKRTESVQNLADHLLVSFDNGESLTVDMIVVSAGIRPRDELAREAGLELGSRGGIVVDDTLATSDPNIFGIGECVSHRGTVYGLVGPCYQMADVLASRLLGNNEAKFTNGDQSAKLKLLGIDVATFGEPLGETVSAKVVSYQSTSACRKLILRENRLVGALAVGAWPEVDRVRMAISQTKRLRSWHLRRFRKTGDIWGNQVTSDVASWPPGALICSCVGVNRAELSSACETGCDSVEAIANKTGASTVCGSCLPLIEQMVGKSAETKQAVAGRRGLLVSSIIALVLIALYFAFGPIDFSDSVASTRHSLDYLWRNEVLKQVTGYTLVGITAVSLLLSLRKRIKRFSLGAFGTWRMAHAVLGATTLVGLLAHTGFHFGKNLNYWLMTCFVGINLVGAITGMIAAMESKATGKSSLALRQWRPRFTLLHILLFWPLPILIAVHIFSVYYY